MSDVRQPTTTEPIPEQFRRGQWAPVAYTLEEGGQWIPINESTPYPTSFSAIRYENGWIYDTILKAQGLNPWRSGIDS